MDTHHFDIDKVVEPNSNLPHTWPSLDVFAEHMQNMNIYPDDDIVCYDNLGIFSSARAAYMFRYFGAGKVRVLNGGLKKWLLEGLPTVGGAQEPFANISGKEFNYRVDKPEMVVTEINQVHLTAYYIFNKATDFLILDARGASRFNAEVPEPRKGVRAGHITGSKNLPFPDLIDAETGALKSDKELAQIFLEKDIDTTKNTLNSCGSGVTACILDLGLLMMGAEQSRIYDGSWTEYGQVEEPDFTHGSKHGWDEPGKKQQ